LPEFKLLTAILHMSNTPNRLQKKVVHQVGCIDLKYNYDQIKMLTCYRLSFADALQYCADTEHADVPILGLLDNEYGKRRANLISKDTGLEVCIAGNRSRAW